MQTLTRGGGIKPFLSSPHVPPSGEIEQAMVALIKRVILSGFPLFVRVANMI